MLLRTAVSSISYTLHYSYALLSDLSLDSISTVFNTYSAYICHPVRMFPISRKPKRAPKRILQKCARLPATGADIMKTSVDAQLPFSGSPPIHFLYNHASPATDREYEDRLSSPAGPGHQTTFGAFRTEKRPGVSMVS